MKLLLDTHAFPWAVVDPDRLSPASRSAPFDRMLAWQALPGATPG